MNIVAGRRQTIGLESKIDVVGVHLLILITIWLPKKVYVNLTLGHSTIFFSRFLFFFFFSFFSIGTPQFSSVGVKVNRNDAKLA
jgi:hypothetical protein